jgi:hypothetical protein
MRSHKADLIAEIGSIGARNEQRETGFAFAGLGKPEVVSFGPYYTEGADRALLGRRMQV